METKPGFAKRQEVVGHSTSVQVEKFSADQVAFATAALGHEPLGHELRTFFAEPEDGVVVDDDPNLTTTLGLGILTNCLMNVTTANFSAANLCAIGVGSSSTAATAADTDLGTPVYYQIADSTPTRVTLTVTNDTLQVVSTFASGNANAAWNEWGLIVATTGTLVSAATKAGAGTASLFNHKIAALGTKASGAAWTFTVKLTWT